MRKFRLMLFLTTMALAAISCAKRISFYTITIAAIISPTGKATAFIERDGLNHLNQWVRVTDLKNTRITTRLAEVTEGSIGSIHWSPNDRFLAVANTGTNGFRSVIMVDLIQNTEKSLSVQKDTPHETYAPHWENNTDLSFTGVEVDKPGTEKIFLFSVSTETITQK